MREVTIPAIWASGAGDPPASPITGITYRNSEISNADIESGWAYFTDIDSSQMNEVMGRMTELMQMLEANGILPWCNLTSYTAGALCILDGQVYQSLQSPNSGKSPTLYPAYWEAVKLKYVLPVATNTVLGGVKKGTGVAVAGDGTLTLEAATTNALGGVKTGTNINNASGTISVNTGTDAVKGVLSVGSRLTVSNGEVNAALASGSVFGVVKTGANVTNNNGVISVADANAWKTMAQDEIGTLVFGVFDYDRTHKDPPYDIIYPGDTAPGGLIFPVGVAVSGAEAGYVKPVNSLSGTWRCLGYVDNRTVNAIATLFQKVSNT